jgi:hypothetical protein
MSSRLRFVSFVSGLAKTIRWCARVIAILFAHCLPRSVFSSRTAAGNFQEAIAAQAQVSPTVDWLSK